MTTDKNENLNDRDQQKLNTYLKELEKQLEEIAVADRCDILMELNSHIQESLAKGEQSIYEILEALGKPAQVANSYRLAKGYKAVPPTKTSPWRWALYGGLGFAGLIFVGLIGILFVVAISLKQFFPIFEVSENPDRVRILGGLVDIDEDQGRLTIGKGFLKVNGEDVQVDIHSHKMEGTIPLGSDLKDIRILGNNGKFEIYSTTDETLSYDCQVLSGEPISRKKPFELDKDSGQVLFDFNKEFSGVSCDLGVPTERSIHVKVDNGSIELDDLAQNIFVEASNGRIEVDQPDGVVYDVEANSVNGLVRDKRRRQEPTTETTYRVSLQITNGAITIDD